MQVGDQPVGDMSTAALWTIDVFCIAVAAVRLVNDEPKRCLHTSEIE